MNENNRKHRKDPAYNWMYCLLNMIFHINVELENQLELIIK